MPRPSQLLVSSLALACSPVAAPDDSATTTGTTTSTASASSSTPTTTHNPSTTAPDTSTSADATLGMATTLGLDFIIRLDYLNPKIECDPYVQDCPPGQKCAPWADRGGTLWDALKCVDIAGDGAPGDPCTATGPGSGMDDCALGSICWDLDAKNQGTCVAQCSGSFENPICPPQHSCSYSRTGVIDVCIFDCNPLTQDCPGDDLCIPNGNIFLCVQDASGDAGQTNGPCEFANSCDKGLICLDSGTASSACDLQASGCCQPYCEFPAGPCPNPDQQCLRWFDPMQDVPPNYKNIGICAVTK